MSEYLQAIKNLEFRKEKLLEQAKKIETLLSGRHIQYFELMESEKGVYSESKTWEMVEELMDALKRYKHFAIYYEEGEEAFELTELEERFCRSFLYCVLRWGYSGAGAINSYMGKGEFQDLVMMAKDISAYRNYPIEDLLYEEQYEITRCIPFHVFNDLYSQLTQEHISSTANEEELLSMRQKYASQIEEIERFWKEEEQRQLDEYGGEMTLDEIYADMERVRKQTAEDIVLELEEMEEKAIANFAEKESFVKQYLIFRESFFKISMELKYHIAEDIEGMLDVYLYEKGFSKFLEDELFFQTYAMIRKTANYVEGYMPESVK